MEKFYLKYCENRKNLNQDWKYSDCNTLVPIFCIQPYKFSADTENIL